MKSATQNDIAFFNDFFIGLKASTPQTYKNMTLVPLNDYIEHKVNYISLAEAIEKDFIIIKEIDKFASVSNLKVVNTSDKNVLILDGEQFIGAKQNRIINATVLVPPLSKVIIDVSCVEEGRWAFVSEKFNSSKNMLDFKVRASKMDSVHNSLRFSHDYKANQGEIWDDVHDVLLELNVKSGTGALEDAYINKEDDLKKFTNEFRLVKKQNGALFFIDGEAVAMEFISLPEIFEANFNKIVKSYALHAIKSRNKMNESDDFIEDANQFINLFIAADIERYKSIGKGYDFRFEKKNIRASVLVVDDEIIHFIGFNPKTNKKRKDKWINIRNLPDM